MYVFIHIRVYKPSIATPEKDHPPPSVATPDTVKRQKITSCVSSHFAFALSLYCMHLTPAFANVDVASCMLCFCLAFVLHASHSCFCFCCRSMAPTSTPPPLNAESDHAIHVVGFWTAVSLIFVFRWKNDYKEANFQHPPPMGQERHSPKVRFTDPEKQSLLILFTSSGWFKFETRNSSTSRLRFCLFKAFPSGCTFKDFVRLYSYTQAYPQIHDARGCRSIG